MYISVKEKEKKKKLMFIRVLLLRVLSFDLKRVPVQPSPRLFCTQGLIGSDVLSRNLPFWHNFPLTLSHDQHMARQGNTHD